MYAKLVAGSRIQPGLAIRDIARLLVSQNPSTANLEGFSQATSVIIDNTPAGWTYVVGSQLNIVNNSVINVQYTTANTNGPDLGQGVSGNNVEQHVVTANSLSPMSIAKYACLTTAQLANDTSSGIWSNSAFYLTAATNANSTTGVVTNETFRVYGQSGANNSVGFGTTAGTYHLVANKQHITLIREDTANGMVQAHWETSQTEYHQFYQMPPVISYCYGHGRYLNMMPTYPANANATVLNSGPTRATSSNFGAPSGSVYWDMYASLINYTYPVTGTNYGICSMTFEPVNQSTFVTPYLFIDQSLNSMSTRENTGITPSSRPTTVSASGLTRQMVNPILFSAFHLGIPVTFVTGIVPIYMLKGGVGTTGDTVTINNINYVYFNVHNTSSGTNNSSPLALAMLTS